MKQRAILRNAVQKENVLLHGNASPRTLHEIRPSLTHDNEMAVCATPYPEIAIYYAVLKACTSGLRGYRFGYESHKNGKIEFYLCQGILDRLLNSKVQGSVYVFPKESFVQWKGNEYRAYESLYSDRVLTVSNEHLPFLPTDGQNRYMIKLDQSVLLN